MKLALNFTTIRFMPFAETAEFANVGVLVYAPKTGYLDFKLAPRRFKRISNFFDDLDGTLYSTAISTFTSELTYLKQASKGMKGHQLVNFMNEVTRKREGIMVFGETSVIRTGCPEESLLHLYSRFVGRSFASSKEHREQVMLRALRKDLSKFIINVKYNERELYTGFSKFKLPLVAETKDCIRAIKPLSFNQDKPLQLVDHGDRWISRIKHLIRAKAISKDNFLFTIEKPKYNSDEFINAFKIVDDGMRELGVKVFPFEEKESILEFAKFESDKNMTLI